MEKHKSTPVDHRKSAPCFLRLRKSINDKRQNAMVLALLLTSGPTRAVRRRCKGSYLGERFKGINNFGSKITVYMNFKQKPDSLLRFLMDQGLRREYELVLTALPSDLGAYFVPLNLHTLSS
jgi:hypothetical protein